MDGGLAAPPARLHKFCRACETLIPLVGFPLARESLETLSATIQRQEEWGEQGLGCH